MRYAEWSDLLSNNREYKFELKVFDEVNQKDRTFIISVKAQNAYDAKIRMEDMVEDWMRWKYDVQVDNLDVTDLKLLSIEGLEECQ